MRESIPLRVAVVSPYPLVAAGLVGLVQRAPDRALVVQAPASCSSLAAEADVVVCDVAAAVGDPAPPRRLLARAVPVVAVARMTEDTATARDVLGAVNVLREDVSPEGLLAALERAVGREPAALRSGAPAARPLTGRETDVVRLIAAGYSNEEICRDLFVGINSVKSYIRTAYKAMGVRTRSEAILWALRHGLASVPCRCRHTGGTLPSAGQVTHADAVAQDGPAA